MDPPLIDLDDDDDVLSATPTSSSHPLDPSPPPPPIYVERFFHSSSSDDDEDGETFNDAVSSKSIESTSKRLDYMLQFLDRKLSSASFSPQKDRSSLPEFVAKGGGSGIFKLPLRSAVHPGRPPCLELRPRPLRESQIACFLRTITASGYQLWAGSESGVRVWDFKDLYEPGIGDPKTGDEYTAPFRQSESIPPTMCLVGDEASGVMWSGHGDGRIRCWKMKTHHLNGDQTNRLKESFSWEAHRGPVLSLVLSSCGDIWSGSEGGGIRIWPWEAIEKALSLTKEERHMAALIVERSYIDQRSQLNLNGFSNIFTSDVKYLLSDKHRAKVWSAGYLSFALWDARTRELLKVFNTDGQIENRVDFSSAQDFSVEYGSGSKKEKVQGSFGFFQRSRNAIMGAADAVRRVAVKGAFGDDNRRTEALVLTIDGMIWTGCTSGLLVQWDGSGNRRQEFQYHSFAVQCFCTFGPRIWIGYASGAVQVLDLGGKLLGGWEAHSCPVIEMTFGAGNIFTLANHGGIRGWSITSPGPLDSLLYSELAGKEFLFTRIENVNILGGTWNVGQGRATQDSLISWLGTGASDAGIVVVGLQEVEMGAGVLARTAAQETVGIEGSSVGQWWLDMIGKTLDEGSTFERVGSRQLAGLLIAVWVRNDLRAHVGDVDAAAVPCGFGRAIGNKGAVGLRLRVYDRIMCFVNCHFAAHLEAVNRRNADFERVYQTMTFCRPTNLFNAGAVGFSSAVQMLRGTNAIGGQTAEGIPELSEADFIMFLGDFNYRLDGVSYDEARDFISQRSFDWLKERDQLQAEMKAGNVFQGMREAVITFPPTYKFERHQPGLAGYDSGEKKRVPAWCDRILYRDSRLALASECSLGCPVVSSILRYEACMDVTDSDHKPVRGIFNVDIARVDESIRRQVLGEIIGSNEKIKALLEELCKIPETIVSTNNIILQNQDTSILRITNRSGKNEAFFEIICEGQSYIKEDRQASDHSPRGSFGFPHWLEVTPAAGVIRTNHIAEISVHHDEFQTLEEFVDGVPQNCWCEDNRDKEVILVVKVRGSYTTETRNHRLRVRHCFAAKAKKIDPGQSSPRQIQGAILHRADLQNLSSSYDVVDHFRKLHGP